MMEMKSGVGVGVGDVDIRGEVGGAKPSELAKWLPC